MYKPDPRCDLQYMHTDLQQLLKNMESFLSELYDQYQMIMEGIDEKEKYPFFAFNSFNHK